MVENNQQQKVIPLSMNDKEEIATNISVRGEYDAIMEIMGDHGCRIIYRNAGLLSIFKNPPVYDFNPCISLSKCARLYREVLNLVGLNGAIGIWRRIGYTSTKYVAEIGRVSVLIEKDLSQDEKYLKVLELYRAAIDDGRVVIDQDGKINFERPKCFLCVGYKEKRPICSLTEGCLQYFADHIYGKDVYKVRETKCKAMGDETCYYVLEKTV